MHMPVAVNMFWLICYTCTESMYVAGLDVLAVAFPGDLYSIRGNATIAVAVGS